LSYDQSFEEEASGTRLGEESCGVVQDPAALQPHSLIQNDPAHVEAAEESHVVGEDLTAAEHVDVVDGSLNQGVDLGESEPQAEQLHELCDKLSGFSFALEAMGEHKLQDFVSAAHTTKYELVLIGQQISAAYKGTAKRFAAGEHKGKAFRPDKDLSFAEQIEQWQIQKQHMQEANNKAMAKRGASNMLEREKKRLATTLLHF
jgi:hypothetical protein